jgi:DNA topoisomerase-2
MGNERGYSRPEYTIKKIIDVSSKYKDTYVYDLETDNHHFHGSIGNIIVHNCDGTHITSLLMNFVEYFWPELLELNYIQICPTPIVKVTKKDDIMSFYTLSDFDEWKNSTKNASTYTIKYYKGLGTSTPKEAKECLKDVDTKLIKITKDVNAHSSIELAFNKDLADDRKEWLMKRYNREDNINRNEREVSTSDFINKELIHFSYYDNERSLPNIVDGLKPSQRKIMYGALKYLMNSEMKVAQFGAKVAEKTDYHHGEASLMGAIIGMAQNYMGSNNINLLEPIGGFGSRQNNSDAASPRYIFTKTSELAKLLFNEYDMKLLKYNESDGYQIEPEWFIPVLPVILINGTVGIGSGFSTNVLKYNVNDIADYYISKMNKQPLVENIDPWYRGFKGKIIRETKNKYRSEGVFEIIPEKSMIQITELPVGVWTDDYKEYLESLLTDKNSNVKDININTSDVSIDFKIYFTTLGFKDIEKMNYADLIKMLKLSNKLSCNNMYLFNKNHIITKYNDVFEILDYFYNLRLEYYELRKQYIIEDLNKQLNLLSNKARFVRFVKNGNIKLQKVTKKDVIIKLTNEGFDQIPNTDTEFKYLTSIPFVMFTDDYIKKLESDTQSKSDELNIIKETTITEMWQDDIINILIKNDEINQELECENQNSILSKKNTTSKKKRVTKK